jgi:aspartate 1-decarboxylase
VRTLLHSRLETVITETNLNYQGSITLDPAVMQANDIMYKEQVHVLNKNNGQRFVTYAIPGNGVCLNGAAARLGQPGDQIIILTYHLVEV